MCAFALCLGMNSCIKETKDATDQAKDAVEQAKDAVEQVVEETPVLADVVAKAKAEGANWSVDEWKEAFKQTLLAIKPMMVDMKEISDKMKEDPSKAVELMTQMKDLEKKYPDFSKLMDEFSELAEATANGKVVIDDEEWGKKIMEELGVPDIDEE